MAFLQRRGSSSGNENHSFSHFESKQLNFVSEAFSCLSFFHSSLTLLYLGVFEINSVQGMANCESVRLLCCVLTLNGKFVYSLFMIIKLPLHSCNLLKTKEKALSDRIRKTFCEVRVLTIYFSIL